MERSHGKYNAPADAPAPSAYLRVLEYSTTRPTRDCFATTRTHSSTDRCYSHPLEWPRATTRATSSGARRRRGHALAYKHACHAGHRCQMHHASRASPRASSTRNHRAALARRTRSKKRLVRLRLPHHQLSPRDLVDVPQPATQGSARTRPRRPASLEGRPPRAALAAATDAASALLSNRVARGHAGSGGAASMKERTLTAAAFARHTQRRRRWHAIGE